MYVNYNPNPLGRRVDDCMIRALAKALSISWDNAFDELSAAAKSIADMQNSNASIDLILRTKGFTRHIIPDTCPLCYTANAFCKEHPIGVYVLGFGDHIATIVDGDIYDSWNSGEMIPLYYYRKEN